MGVPVSYSNLAIRFRQPSASSPYMGSKPSRLRTLNCRPSACSSKVDQPGGSLVPCTGGSRRAAPTAAPLCGLLPCGCWPCSSWAAGYLAPILALALFPSARACPHRHSTSSASSAERAAASSKGRDLRDGKKARSFSGVQSSSGAESAPPPSRSLLMVFRLMMMPSLRVDWLSTSASALRTAARASASTSRPKPSPTPPFPPPLPTGAMGGRLAGKALPLLGAAARAAVSCVCAVSTSALACSSAACVRSKARE
mmetsp:Transcript_42635/g.96513  ORF Transcript_42635/g.96513 Transcript_42635/m.96513 type:complete len:255 (-) Transcript_42635:541-1305(-)